MGESVFMALAVLEVILFLLALGLSWDSQYRKAGKVLWCIWGVVLAATMVWGIVMGIQ